MTARPPVTAMMPPAPADQAPESGRAGLSDASREHRDAPLRVAIIGNPNTGKTTLFNALTGLRQRVGNFAGVTVERVEGSVKGPDGHRFTVLDLPGSYSLSAGSPDEQVALEVLLHRDSDRWTPDVVLVVVDAVHLERNLFLTSQVSSWAFRSSSPSISTTWRKTRGSPLTSPS